MQRAIPTYLVLLLMSHSVYILHHSKQILLLELLFRRAVLSLSSLPKSGNEPPPTFLFQ